MRRAIPWLYQPIEHDVESVHVDDDFDEVNYQRLTENYGRNQRSKTDEAEYRYA